ncbi:TrbI/VirB10 family protein [Nostoc sp. MS1]|uniref:TrbI/VirB10 family protein n=1 Tax=Nostoc sp. MS1 TaxID=2764711 RepID=UPI001CC5C193|nr:TrbI/VirB10 family protein [Nostoc sp. MS1]BCL34438.1 hypothetical protein NSMS1_08850 [Nostoc sp. MS1]
MTYETQPKSLTHLEVDPADWESQMARLVGLAAEPANHTPDIVPIQPSPTSPQEVKTEQPLSSNPFAKLALVGTATLVMVMVAGVFLTQLMSAGNQKSKPKSSTASQPETPATNFAPQQNLEQEVETLKTKLALAEQAQAVKVAQQNLRNAPRVIATATPQTNTSVPRVTVTQATPTSARRRVEGYAPNPYPYTPPIPVVSSSNPQVPPPPVVVSNPAPTPLNPWEQWRRLSKVGSYGQANPVDQPSMTVSQQQPVTAPRPQLSNNEYQPPQPPNYGMSQGQSRNPQALKVGTSAKAVLATAVFGETTRNRSGNNNNDDNDSKNTFVIRLTEPLKGADGAIAVPANTEILTELKSVSEQGVMQLNLTKMIVQNNGVLSERDIPNNALTIRGAGGSPLLAKQYPDRGSSIAGMDAGLFVLGGIAKGAELFNRTDSSVVVNGGSTTVTTGNNRRNYVAGVVEGGLNSVVPQISQRNQQAVAQMMQQTNVWLLGAGTQVEIYVNQAVQL